MTYREALRAGRTHLLEAGVPDADLDAWYLLEFIRKRSGLPGDRTWFLMNDREEMPDSEAKDYRELLDRRAERIPLQHLTGEQEFMGLSFLVTPEVLVPRQDTEILAEEALSRLKPGMAVLDMCTGSGCIIVSLARLCPGIRAAASDLSSGALAVAKENAKRLDTAVSFFQGDLFEGVEGLYDVIVSNPPYIPTDDISGLMDEVRLHEPVMALDGQADGLYFYRRLAKESRDFLKPGGCLLLEIGYDQGDAVKNLLEEAGFCNVCVKKDLAGLDRVVAAENRGCLA